MKKITSLIFIALISIFISINQANAQSMTENKVIKIIKPLMQKYHIDGVAVALIKNGKKNIYLFGKTTQGIPITDKTIFQLGSITKVFTTLIFSEEIQNHQMKFSDSMTHYLTQFSRNPHFNRISLEQLATFASGLPFNQPNSINTKYQLQWYLLHWQPEAYAKNKWRYSNLSIGLLGDILAAQNYQSLNKIFENNIFIPLHMPASNLNSCPQTPPLSEVFLPGTWALKSTILDMSNFLSAAIGLPNTPKNILLAMHIAQTPRIQIGNMRQALAWQVFSLKNPHMLLDSSYYMDVYGMTPMHILPENQQHYDPNTLIDKSGITHGFQSYIAVIPSQKSGIIIIINSRQVPLNNLIQVGREILLKS